jgi:hypothetical protein
LRRELEGRGIKMHCKAQTDAADEWRALDLDCPIILAIGHALRNGPKRSWKPPADRRTPTQRIKFRRRAHLIAFSSDTD